MPGRNFDSKVMASSTCLAAWAARVQLRPPCPRLSLLGRSRTSLAILTEAAGEGEAVAAAEAAGHAEAVSPPEQHEFWQGLMARGAEAAAAEKERERSERALKWSCH